MIMQVLPTKLRSTSAVTAASSTTSTAAAAAAATLIGEEGNCDSDSESDSDSEDDGRSEKNNLFYGFGADDDEDDDDDEGDQEGRQVECLCVSVCRGRRRCKNCTEISLNLIPKSLSPFNLKGRRHVGSCVRIAVRFRVRFPAQGGSQINFRLIFTEMC
jgi:hypothetical protein